MVVIGFEESEITSLFRIVAIILKLGNVSFKHRNNFDGTNGCSVSDGEGGSNRYTGYVMKLNRIVYFRHNIPIKISYICIYTVV